jgi:hypothetical protein
MIRSTDGTALVSNLPNASVAATTSNVHAPAAATAAVLTFAAVEGKRYVLRGVEWSYSATPTGGNIKVENGSGVTVFNADVPAAGANSIVFEPPIVGSPNTALVVTLASGAGSVVGKVNARPYTE